MTAIDFHKLAKTELHCHLDGSLSLETIRHLADLAQIELPEDDAELKHHVTAPATCESLLDYLEAFDYIRPLLQTKEALTIAAYDVAKQAALENVIYIEVRFAPELSMDKGLTVAETIDAVCQGLRQAQEEFGIVAKALVCGMRQSDQELTARILDEANEVEDSDFVGFDFAGDEHHYGPKAIKPLIEQVQSYNRPMTFHAGECGCPAFLAESIAMGIKRNGHATILAQEPELLEEFVKNGVTGELCLTSNLQTKAAVTVADFPYLKMKAAGANITINTDNRTVSDTNLTKEYELYHKHFDSSVQDFYAHNKTAIEASFASDEEKEELLEKLAKAYS
ncbi:adenosine deaminase [Streptococcus salivarius]|uniref:adenosine deaminase n=1 Tax=Streptococcus salivarius TaxID=1304 RepID=UPI002284A4DB|nr:adenosine deaminase [Streptococcus salivarius]MCY7054272.1 adenosine deaminase [Streptococcus salivarius]